VNRSAKPDSQRQRIRLVIGFVIFLTAAVLFSIYNAEVIGFSNEVWQNIKRVPVALLVVAITFRLLEALFTALSWYNVLKATYPEKRIHSKSYLAVIRAG
jgi:hypothetical protein